MTAATVVLPVHPFCNNIHIIQPEHIHIELFCSTILDWISFDGAIGGDATFVRYPNDVLESKLGDPSIRLRYTTHINCKRITRITLHYYIFLSQDMPS